MSHRAIPILAAVCIALGLGGCASLWSSSNRKPKKQYQEVVMPHQTGSLLTRRIYVPRGPDSKVKKQKKEREKSRKAEAEPSPSPTPAPEEESTPSADRFR